MTNGEKYKTAMERIKAFDKWCSEHQNADLKLDVCADCPICGAMGNCESDSQCQFAWLDLEAEEEKKPLPCPFCPKSDVVAEDVGGWDVTCRNCGYTSPVYPNMADAIDAHNRVAKAVMDAKEGCAK